MFYFMLVIHVVAGSICLLTGAAAIVAKKRRGIHTVTGEVYHGSYFVVFVTSVGMAVANWSESAYLFYIALFSYGLALFGYVIKKLERRDSLQYHIGGMLGSYIGIVTAVLVVNAGKLPVINHIPILLVWFLPTIIGTPLIIMTGNRYAKRTNHSA